MGEKLEYVDSLRGIAILMVMLVHTAQSVPELPRYVLNLTKYGQLGVQLFFVVSAITLSLSAERRSGEAHATRKFFIRRFFRIAPLYYFGILLYFLYRSMQASLGTGTFQPAAGYTAVNMLANLAFVHGFHPPSHNYIVPGGWSIGTEMAFYACFPLLFPLFKRMSARGALRFVILYALMLGAYYLLEHLYVVRAGTPVVRNAFIFYNLVNQLPVFTLGILAHFLAREGVLAKIPVLADLLLLALFVWVTLILWQRDDFMFVPFTAGLAFVFLYNLFVKVLVLNVWILRRIGQVSYSMYILHFMIAWYGVEYLHHWLAATGRPILLLGMYYLLTLLLAFGAALVSEKVIEKPGIEAGRRVIQKMGKAGVGHA